MIDKQRLIAEVRLELAGEEEATIVSIVNDIIAEVEPAIHSMIRSHTSQRKLRLLLTSEKRNNA